MSSTSQTKASDYTRYLNALHHYLSLQTNVNNIESLCATDDDFEALPCLMEAARYQNTPETDIDNFFRVSSQDHGPLREALGSCISILLKHVNSLEGDVAIEAFRDNIENRTTKELQYHEQRILTINEAAEEENQRINTEYIRLRDLTPTQVVNLYVSEKIREHDAKMRERPRTMALSKTEIRVLEQQGEEKHERAIPEILEEQVKASLELTMIEQRLEAIQAVLVERGVTPQESSKQRKEKERRIEQQREQADFVDSFNRSDEDEDEEGEDEEGEDEDGILEGSGHESDGLDAQLSGDEVEPEPPQTPRHLDETSEVADAMKAMNLEELDESREQAGDDVAAASKPREE